MLLFVINPNIMMLLNETRIKIEKALKGSQPDCLIRITLCPQTPQRFARRGRPVQYAKKNLEEFSEMNLEAASDAEAALAEEPEHVADHPEIVEGGALQGDQGGAAEGEHACNECGLVFHRRYALIMHALKHEKTRSFKCSVCSHWLNKK